MNIHERSWEVCRRPVTFGRDGGLYVRYNSPWSVYLTSICDKSSLFGLLLNAESECTGYLRQTLQLRWRAADDAEPGSSRGNVSSSESHHVGLEIEHRQVSASLLIS